MSALDIFAWIVLVVFACSTIAVIVILGFRRPGRIAAAYHHKTPHRNAFAAACRRDGPAAAAADWETFPSSLWLNP
jgi:hypothetical protein